MRTLSMLGARRGRGDTTLYARAIPERVELTENYAVQQEISRNPSMEQVGDGTGRIEVSVPYDGHRYFTRLAVADTERALGPPGASADRQATIGHLLLVDHARTTGLHTVLRPHNQSGVIPLTIPVAARNGFLDLTADRQACEIAYDYRPDGPQVYPIELEVHLFDPDSLNDEADSMSGAFGTMKDLVARGRSNASLTIEKLRQQASFSSELLLAFVVRVSVPVKAGHPAPSPVVRDMSVEWPTLTSLSSTKLRFGLERQPVRYNPVRGRLEWAHLPMHPLPGGSGEEVETRIFHSATALLSIGHPGELFKEERLEVNAQVEIPNYLLSGLDAHLFDAAGGRPQRQPTRTTRLNIRTVVHPTDIFTGRTFSPYQQFIFDDLIPDEMRVTDIVTVLRNARFTVEELRPQAQHDPLAPMWLLHANRSQGPDALDLLIAVEGKRFMLDREQIMAASIKISGSKESGQLKVSVLGTLRRDHRELTRVMNALQHELRDRFRFHQTSRR